MSILNDQTPLPPQPPVRAPTDEALSDLWWPVLVALLMWMLVPAAMLGLARTRETRSDASTTRATGDYTPRELTLMAVSGSAAGLVTLLIATSRLGKGVADRLGLSRQRFRAGLRQGILASLIIVPLMFGVMQATQWFWNRIHYQHPEEHELLRAMGESSSPIIRVTLILSAVVLAPMFEELMFRGYLQTAIGATLSRRLPRNNPRWPAIILASVAFTLVHVQPWLMPPIFFLSLCLGYLYERTGNLWAPVIVHASFNAVSTTLFLYFR